MKFSPSLTPSHALCNMHCSNNLHLCNETLPPNVLLLNCPNPQCTHSFRSATSLTLHIHRGNHSINDMLKDISSLSPTTVDSTTADPQAQLKASSPPPPVQPFVPLFPKLEQENPSSQPLQYTSSTTTRSTSPSRSSPLNFPPASPISVNMNSSSSSTKNTTTLQSHIDNFEAQLASLIGGMLDKHEGLLDKESNSGGGNSNADNEEHDDAGVPVKQNYHPNLNGMYLINFMAYIY